MLTTEQKANVIKWLDDVVAFQERIGDIADEYGKKYKYRELGDGKTIETCNSYECTIIHNEIHVYSGIEYIAEAIGQKVKRVERDSDEYKWEYSVEYKNCHVFEIRAD